MSITVVLADDHPMYRYGLAALLAQTEGVDLLASVSDGAALVAATAEHRPDVVVTDLAMPGMDGIRAIRELLSKPPEPAILVLTMHDDDDHVFAALRAGASGYLVKGADGAEILRAIASVAAGEAVYGAAIARRIVGFYAGQPEQSAADRAFPGLTRRERDVLELLAIGCRNHEIARRLGMSEKTVRNHVSQILLKLQVPDRTAAALAARTKGIGPPDGPHRTDLARGPSPG